MNGPRPEFSKKCNFLRTNRNLWRQVTKLSSNREDLDKNAAKRDIFLYCISYIVCVFSIYVNVFSCMLLVFHTFRVFVSFYKEIQHRDVSSQTRLEKLMRLLKSLSFSIFKKLINIFLTNLFLNIDSCLGK